MKLSMKDFTTISRRTFRYKFHKRQNSLATGNRNFANQSLNLANSKYDNEYLFWRATKDSPPLIRQRLRQIPVATKSVIFQIEPEQMHLPLA